MAGKKQLFSNPDGYKFVQPDGTITAVLDADGRFTLKDGANGASLEVFPNWTDFVRNMGEHTVKTGLEEDILKQLSSFGLGQSFPISREISDTPKRKAPEAIQTSVPKQEKEDMAKKAAPKKAAPKAAAKKEKAPAELKPCACGCGEETPKTFRPGHDARVHGWAKKVQRGEMKLSELQAITKAWMKEHGIQQGAKPAA